MTSETKTASKAATLAEPKQLRTTTIMSLVDVVGALANNTLSENIYLLDNNAGNGSSNECTETLKTKVQTGDLLVWTVQALEPESYAGITDILIDKAYCDPKLGTYPGSDVTFWSGKVKQDIEHLAYDIKIKVGTRDKVLKTVAQPSLIGTR